MLSQKFRTSLGKDILPNLVTVGIYNGKNPFLTFVTKGGKIVIYSPRHALDNTGAGKGVENAFILNINQEITAIAAGKPTEDAPRDFLVIGTRSSILVYDVLENCDVFFKEISEGAFSIQIGSLGEDEDRLVLIAGESVIQGFDFTGNDEFWNLCRDEISTFICHDVNEDKMNELIVATEDSCIRLYEEEEMTNEIKESDIVIQICSLNGPHYGFALVNGTIGVYSGTSNLWKTRSAWNVQSLLGFDIGNTGKLELLVGYTNGRVEARNRLNGTVLWACNMNSNLSGLVTTNFHDESNNELLVCLENGDVIGYSGISGDLKETLSDAAEEERLEALNKEKQDLLLELRNLTPVKSVGVKAVTDGKVGSSTICNLSVSLEKGVCLTVTLANNLLITAIILQAEGIFAEDTHIVNGSQLPKISASLHLNKDLDCDLKIKIIATTASTNQLQVISAQCHLPKFSRLYPVSTMTNPPKSSSIFKTSTDINTNLEWLRSRFLSIQDIHVDQAGGTFLFNVVCINDGTYLSINRKKDEMEILSDSMDLTADVTNDFCLYHSISDLNVDIHFPLEEENLKGLLRQVDEYNAVRLKLSTETADTAVGMKGLVVKAEDCRILGDMSMMKKTFALLHDLNRDLIGEHAKRTANHQRLVAALKSVNQIVQKAANIRVGKPRLKIVNAAREAIRLNDGSIFKAIRSGTELDKPSDPAVDLIPSA